MITLALLVFAGGAVWFATGPQPVHEVKPEGIDEEERHL